MSDSQPFPSAARTVIAAWVAIAAVVSGLPAAGAKGAAGTEQGQGRPPAGARAGAHVIPADYRAGVFFAKATINGVGPFWFTIDTGSTVTVVNPRTALQLGLPVRDAGAGLNVGTASGPTSMGTTSNASIQVGDLVPVIPEPLFVVAVDANEELLGHRIDGVLGTDFLGRYTIEFDYSAGTVTAYDAGAFVYGGRQTPIPLRLARNGLLAPATLTLPDGEKLAAQLLIDTGSNIRVTLNGPFVRRHRLIERFPSTTMTASYGINGLTTSPLIAARSLALGSVTIASPNVGLSRETSGLHGSAEFDGIVASELLKAFRVIIDYSRAQMILERPSAR
jgi:predicted aspartyl protease